MKKMILVSLLLFSSIALADMNSYCTAPPFVGGHNAVVIPNVLITHDMTGSMRFYAYHNYSEPYNPAVRYYGYADPDADYGRVWAAGHYYFQKKPAGSGTYSGNQINYAFMTRMDISRKAFTGGKGVTVTDKSRLEFELPSRQTGFNSYTYYGIVTTDSTEITKGIIRTIADVDNNYIWDEGAPYFALQVFSSSSRFYRIVRCPFGSTLNYLLTVFENQDNNNQPTGGTNCGDAIFEAIHYLRFCDRHWWGDYTWNINMVGTAADPWYEVVGNDTVSVSCRPTFCIVVGDGGSNDDHPVGDCGHLPHSASPYGAGYWNFYQYDGDNDPYDNCGWQTHHRCGDDYAYYAHVSDLRPDADPVYGIPDEQSIMFYSVYLFAQGDDSNADSIFFRKVAQYGGFIDSDTAGAPGYKKPDKISEYDADSNGRPDHFFYVNDGQQLEDALTEIFINIQELSRVTSASAGAIQGSGIRGSGIVYNATFYPKIDLTSTLALSWIGKATALWLDKFGNLREETQHDRYLHLKDDYVVEMFFSAGANQTMVARFVDTSGTGTQLAPLDTVPVESLSFLWDGGAHLLNRAASDRKIFYHQNNAVRHNFEIGENWLDSRLDFGNADSCDTLIEYIRGTDFPEYRVREYTPGAIWKLGDIIYSSPMPVSAPAEGYHYIYGDNSYYDFWNQYIERRTVVYAGANDGMLHAFWGGYYESLEDPAHPFRVAEVLRNGQYTGIQDLGKELWGFIPYNVLPHLKWLTDTNYCHVCYLDLKPYPTDAKIFTDDAIHPHGWGTVLISGMRFGGGEIDVPGVDTFRSSYLAFDVTDPETDNGQPHIMWEYTDDSLGFTMCVPAMVRVKDLGANTKWFLIFGSGPQTMQGECTRQASIYIIDPYTGAFIHKITIPDSNSAITNVFGVDFGLQYSVNLFYFGTYDVHSSPHDGGKIYRVMTHNNIDPTTWTLHEVINLNKPITAEGSVATDNRGNLWVYFGCGKYMSNTDVADADTMLFVGIKDDTTNTLTPYTLGDLIDVTNARVYADSVAGMGGVSNFDDLILQIEGAAGWYRRFDSIPGERVVTTPLILGGAVIFTSFIPQDTTGGGTAQGPDLCIGGGGGPQGGNLWALFYTTGTSYKTAMLGETVTGEFKTHIPIIGDMPSEPAMHIGGDQEKVFIQSAGGLIGIETPLPYNPRGGVMLWRGR